MGLLFFSRSKIYKPIFIFFLQMKKKTTMNLLIVYWMLYFHWTVLWYLSLDLAKMFIDHVISVHWLHLMFFSYVRGMVFHMNKILYQPRRVSVDMFRCVKILIHRAGDDYEMLWISIDWNLYPSHWIPRKAMDFSRFAESVDCFIPLRDALWLRVFWAPSVKFIPTKSPLISPMSICDGRGWRHHVQQ